MEQASIFFSENSYDLCVSKPYMTPDIKNEKSKRSSLETKYRQSNTPENHKPYKNQARVVTRMLSAAKRAFFRNTISENQHSPKKLWQSLNSLLHRNTSSCLPNSDTPSELATSFLNYFNDKIHNLRASIPASSGPDYAALSNSVSRPAPPQHSQYLSLHPL